MQQLYNHTSHATENANLADRSGADQQVCLATTGFVRVNNRLTAETEQHTITANIDVFFGQ
jgi:hypothetical protein